jgi:hypothetical protein
MVDDSLPWLGRTTLVMCGRCGKPTWHRRHIGIGTFIAVACTSGLWLLLVPF